MNFPNPPQSALFSKLDAFLPQLAMENHKLEKAIADGKGSDHNIEIEETQQEQPDQEEKTAGHPNKQIIEMNFALGLMENSDSEDDANEQEPDQEKDIELPLAHDSHQHELPKLQLPTIQSGISNSLIQELN